MEQSIIDFCNEAIPIVNNLLNSAQQFGPFDHQVFDECRYQMRQIIDIVEMLSRADQTLFSADHSSHADEFRAYHQLVRQIVRWLEVQIDYQMLARQQMLAGEEELVRALLADCVAGNYAWLAIRDRVMAHRNDILLRYRQWAYYYHLAVLYRQTLRRAEIVERALNQLNAEAGDMRVVNEAQDENIGMYRWRVETDGEADLAVYMLAMARRDQIHENDPSNGQQWRRFNELRYNAYGSVFTGLRPTHLDQPFFRLIIDRQDIDLVAEEEDNTESSDTITAPEEEEEMQVDLPAVEQTLAQREVEIVNEVDAILRGLAGPVVPIAAPVPPLPAPVFVPPPRPPPKGGVKPRRRPFRVQTAEEEAESERITREANEALEASRVAEAYADSLLAAMAPVVVMATPVQPEPEVGPSSAPQPAVGPTDRNYQQLMETARLLASGQTLVPPEDDDEEDSE